MPLWFTVYEYKDTKEFGHVYAITLHRGLNAPYDFMTTLESTTLKDCTEMNI